MFKIGLVGCGTIGSELALAVHEQFHKKAEIAYLYDVNSEAAKKLKHELKNSPKILSLPELVRKSDFVIEAASQEAAIEVLPLVQKFGKSILVMSVGALLRIPHVFSKIKKGLLYVPSGAIAGIDALLATKQGKIKSVTITTRKPLKSLLGAPFFKKSKWSRKKIRGPVTIFEGNALQATKLFPQNINVAATLSLSGIGPKKTKVRIITSPTFKCNSHEVEFVGNSGRVKTLTENVPSKRNPKTSTLAIYSAVASLEKIFSKVKIGT